MTRDLLSMFLAAALGAACTGDISGEASGGEPGPGGEPTNPATRLPGGGPNPVVPPTVPPSAPPTAPAPVSCGGATKTFGPSPLRRLTHDEYANTVRDLLRVELPTTISFPKEGEVWGLTNNVIQQGLDGALIERYFGAAERLSDVATAGDALAKLVACDPVAQGEESCVRAFIDGFGTRAFRRPPSDADRVALQAVFTASRADADFRAGVRGVLEAMLVSPQFLFRTEPGAPGTTLAVDGWAVASRLSYLLWGTMPDETLFSAAKAGRLQSAADIVAQAERMLADARTRPAIARLHAEWLEFDRLAELRKDAAKFPDFAALQPAMRAELDRFVDEIYWKEGGALETLLASPASFVDEKLAKLYGVSGVTGSDLRKVQLDPVKRAGILSRAGLLSSISTETDTGLVHRGLFVRERLLCQAVPPPPPNLDTTLPPAVAGQSTRERFARHKDDPVCAGCHAQMDPIGLALENFDAMGRWRDTENGARIDATGELSGVEGGGPFNGVAELGKRLAASPTVAGCASRVWFRYAFGRTETAADVCTLDVLEGAVGKSGGKTRDLLLALIGSEAFRHRVVAQ